MSSESFSSIDSDSDESVVNLKPKSFQTIIISTKEMDTQMDCLICMEKLQIDEKAMKLNCDHYYHYNCLTTWLANKSSCPKCRRYVKFNPFLAESEDEPLSSSESEVDDIFFNSRPPATDPRPGVPQEEEIEFVIFYERTVRRRILSYDRVYERTAEEEPTEEEETTD